MITFAFRVIARRMHAANASYPYPRLARWIRWHAGECYYPLCSSVSERDHFCPCGSFAKDGFDL